jgi:two-component system chemotaxis sensor kinase CheA
MSDGMDEILQDFVTEAEETLEKVDPLFVQLEERGHDRDILNEIFRGVHTLKGAAGFLGLAAIVEVSHKSEELLKKLRDGEMEISPELISLILRAVDMLKVLLLHIKQRDGAEEDIAPLIRELEEALEGKAPEDGAQGDQERPPEGKEATGAPGPEEVLAHPPPEDLPEALPVPEEGPREPAPKPGGGAAPKGREGGGFQTLRVDVERIDKVMNLTGEIVLVRNRLLNIAAYLEGRYGDDRQVAGLQETVAFLDLVTADMQLAVTKMRMQPIKKVFGKFPRLVRDISQKLGKEVYLNISGEGTEVDRSVIERINDPMVHIIRNAIDHGIEPVEERLGLGKPAKGLVDVTAYQQGNHIVIEVSDDGRGIDSAKVVARAVSRGLIAEEAAQRMTDKEALGLLFLPGFSTVETATELSGRGVGMDVVKTNIAKLNGFVEILTTPGVGSTVRITIPLTLAIIQALMVRASGVQYALPLGAVEETLKTAAADIRDVTGNSVITIREKVYPVAELAEMLGSGGAGAEKDDRYVIVIAIGDRRFCVAVDELLGQEEVVIKAIEGIDTDATGILGATITGDGRIVLILDPASMVRTITGLAAV